MPKLIFLGTSNAIPDERHKNTHLLITGSQRNVLIDCGENPILQLRKIGLDFNLLSDLVLTHFHPDHVAGVPQLLMNMWLMGRNTPLNIFGLQHTLDRVCNLMDLFGWSEWPDFFPVKFHRLVCQEMIPVLECDEFRVRAAPVEHFIPTIGLRFESKISGKVVAYSCDTEPCRQLEVLARGAQVLIHEASGLFPGHSSATQAGEIAAKTKVEALYLIHYPTGEYTEKNLVLNAKKNFPGLVYLAEDLGSLEFD